MTTPALPVPGAPAACERRCTCPDQQRDGPPWTVDGECPLHGYGSPPPHRLEG